MSRPLLLVVISLLSAGCHVPWPKFQPFAGSGSPRVAPPATGSYGKADSYYNSAPGQASAAAGDTANPGLPAANQALLAGGGGASWRTADSPVGTGVVTPASDNGALNTGAIGARISREGLASPLGPPPASGTSPSNPTFASNPGARQAVYVEGQSAASGTPGSLSLNGMRINDATRSAEPQRFIPSGQLIEISQLPRLPAGAATTGAGATGGFVAPTLPSGATSNSAASSAASSATQVSQTPALSADGWRSKYVPLGGGVAAR